MINNYTGKTRNTGLSFSTTC